jgi:hypothetical protein
VSVGGNTLGAFAAGGYLFVSGTFSVLYRYNGSVWTSFSIPSGTSGLAQLAAGPSADGNSVFVVYGQLSTGNYLFRLYSTAGVLLSSQTFTGSSASTTARCRVENGYAYFGFSTGGKFVKGADTTSSPISLSSTVAPSAQFIALGPSGVGYSISGTDVYKIDLTTGMTYLVGSVTGVMSNVLSLAYVSDTKFALGGNVNDGSVGYPIYALGTLGASTVTYSTVTHTAQPNIVVPADAVVGRPLSSGTGKVVYGAWSQRDVADSANPAFLYEVNAS